MKDLVGGWLQLDTDIDIPAWKIKFIMESIRFAFHEATLKRPNMQADSGLDSLQLIVHGSGEHKFIATKMTQKLRLNFIGRVTLIRNVRSCVEVGKYHNIFFMDGIEQTSVATDFLHPAWLVRSSRDEAECTMEISQADVTVAMPNWPRPEKLTFALSFLRPKASFIGQENIELVRPPTYEEALAPQKAGARSSVDIEAVLQAKGIIAKRSESTESTKATTPETKAGSPGAKKSQKRTSADERHMAKRARHLMT